MKIYGDRHIKKQTKRKGENAEREEGKKYRLQTRHIFFVKDGNKLAKWPNVTDRYRDNHTEKANDRHRHDAENFIDPPIILILYLYT